MVDIYAETMRLLDESQQTYTEIAKGAGVKVRWLCRLHNGDYDDPGVKKVEKVYCYLLQATDS